MERIFDVVDGLDETRRALATFVRQVRDWGLLAARLGDLRDGLAAAELSLDAWRRKFDVLPDRPDAYLEVLFGHQGGSRIQNILESVDAAADSVRGDVNSLVRQALSSRSRKTPSDEEQRYTDIEVEKSLRHIQRKPSRSREFLYHAISHTDDLETHLDQLDRKLTLLERLSDNFLTTTHPEIFKSLARLPGRQKPPLPSTTRHQTPHHRLLEGLAARKDAELLHRASTGSNIYLGLSVPQIHKRDFAFLLHLRDEGMQEVLVHPVKITAVNDTARVQSTMATAVPSLLANTHESCYMLPSATSSAGFRVSIPPAAILAPLEYKNPLAILLREHPESLTHQELCPQDQAALACGLASSVFRFIGSPWLHFLDCGNVRCRKNARGQWTSMLDAVPGNAGITDALDEWVVAGLQRRRREERDLVKSTQVFRVGLVLAELALQASIGRVGFDAATAAVNILVEGAEGMFEVVEVEEIAAEVERKTNVFWGNMVESCLKALRGWDESGMREGIIEAVYYDDVLGQAEELEGITKVWRRVSPAGSRVSSAVETPRSARSSRSGDVYVY